MKGSHSGAGTWITASQMMAPNGLAGRSASHATTVARMDGAVTGDGCTFPDLTPSPDSGTVGCQERTGGCCLESLGLGSTPWHAARCGQRQSLARYLLSGEQRQMP